MLLANRTSGNPLRAPGAMCCLSGDQQAWLVQDVPTRSGTPDSGKNKECRVHFWYCHRWERGSTCALLAFCWYRFTGTGPCLSSHPLLFSQQSCPHWGVGRAWPSGLAWCFRCLPHNLLVFLPVCSKWQTTLATALPIFLKQKPFESYAFLGWWVTSLC